MVLALGRQMNSEEVRVHYQLLQIYCTSCFSGWWIVKKNSTGVNLSDFWNSGAGLTGEEALPCWGIWMWAPGICSVFIIPGWDPFTDYRHDYISKLQLFAGVHWNMGLPSSSKTIGSVGLGWFCPWVQTVKTLQMMEERKRGKKFPHIKWENTNILHKGWGKEPCREQSDG